MMFCGLTLFIVQQSDGKMNFEFTSYPKTFQFFSKGEENCKRVGERFCSGLQVCASLCMRISVFFNII